MKLISVHCILFVRCLGTPPHWQQHAVDCWAANHSYLRFRFPGADRPLPVGPCGALWESLPRPIEVKRVELLVFSGSVQTGLSDRPVFVGTLAELPHQCAVLNNPYGIVPSSLNSAPKDVIWCCLLSPWAAPGPWCHYCVHCFLLSVLKHT